METSDYSYQQNAIRRPVFLTVLCVLTFLNSLYAAYAFTRQYSNADKQAVISNNARDKALKKITEGDTSFSNREFSSNKTVSASIIRIAAVVAMISLAFTFVGSVLMWNLKRTGFYYYIIGSAIAALMPPLVLGFGLSALTGMASMAFIGLLFVGMYGLNLKYMTK